MIDSSAVIINCIVSPTFAKEVLSLLDAIVTESILGATLSIVTPEPLVNVDILLAVFPIRSEILLISNPTKPSVSLY